jgi:hypothetical protein
VDVLAPLVVILALAAVVWFVSAPLRAGTTAAAEDRDAAQAADLEAAKEAKYREIRELELDYRTGKVEEADFRAQDRRLRADAVAILRRLDDLGR